MKEILVIGAGPAGIMAALSAVRHGAKVKVFEKNNIVGKKLGITGKGRCNLTNSCAMDDFITHTPGHGKFLFSAYGQFTNEDLLRQLQEWGLKTCIERGGRVFPESHSAVEVRKFFYYLLRDTGADLHLEEPVQAVKAWGSRFVIQTALKMYEGDACIITTGGMSYPSTGATGDGYGFAKALGHTVTELVPSLVPFTVQETWPAMLSGMTLRNVEVSLWKQGKKLASEFGELQCLPGRVSGPVVLRLSAFAAHSKKCAYPLQLRVNLKPALSREQLDKRVQRDCQKYLQLTIKEGMKDLLPHALIPVVLEAAGVDPDAPINQLSKLERSDLVDVLQAVCLTVTGTSPIAEAIVTAGGVSVKEINPKTMESKIVPHLFFAGEVMDIDAFTGGYNLQAAFSTGYVAGMAAAKKER